MSRKKAILYWTAFPDCTCSAGVRARGMLDQNCIEVEEYLLSSRAEVDAFKSSTNVSTTPQVFIGAARIGGAEEVGTYRIQHHDI